MKVSIWDFLSPTTRSKDHNVNCSWRTSVYFITARIRSLQHTNVFGRVCLHVCMSNVTDHMEPPSPNKSPRLHKLAHLGTPSPRSIQTCSLGCPHLLPVITVIKWMVGLRPKDLLIILLQQAELC